MPTTAEDQSCSFCGSPAVTWVHPLHPDRKYFDVCGKQHVMNGFQCVCDGCEALVQRGQPADSELIAARVAQGGDQAGEGDGSASQFLEVFRAADLGAFALVPA